MGRKFCVEIFSQGMEEHHTKSNPRMVKIISGPSIFLKPGHKARL
jgi:hypothetical protein